MVTGYRVFAIGALCCVVLFGCAEAQEPEGTCVDCGNQNDRGSRDTSTSDSAVDMGQDDTTGQTDADVAAVEDMTGDSSVNVGDAPGYEDVPPRGGALIPDPTSVYFSVPAVGASVEQIIRIFNETDLDVTFHSAEVVSTTPGFELVEAPDEALRTPGQGIGFIVRYTAESTNDATADILVHNSFSEPVRIPVIVAAKLDEEDACIQIAPTSLNFGTVVRGSGDEVREFTITNCGSAAISVLRLDRGRVFMVLPTPDEYQWEADRPLPMTLSATQTSTVTVTFSPGTAGLVQGGIDVISNVNGSLSTRVSLTATSQPPPISELDVHLILTWEGTPSDVDFHFMPEGATLFDCDDCYYSNMSPDWGVADDIIDDPFLDYDDLTSGGPENINVDELLAGTYRIVVHYYSDTGTGGDGYSSVEADSTVQVYINGSLRQTFGPTTLESTDDVWDVATLVWDGADGVLTELGDVYGINRSDYTFCSGGGIFP